MHKKIACAVIVACLVFCGVAYGQGTESGVGQNTTGETPAPEKKIMRMNGTVSQVSFVNGEILVTGEPGYIRFDVPDETPISRGIADIALDDIRPGDSVIVQYYIDDAGKKVAVFIRDSTSS
jgi:hypothetical protein